MKSLQFFIILLPIFFLFSSASGAFVGVNIGTAISSRPSAANIVSLLKSQKITHVRLLTPDADLLSALAGTGIKVAIGLPNEELQGIGESRSAAVDWVNRNVAAHFPATNITSITVGSEVLTTLPNANVVLLPAMRFLHAGLVTANLDGKIKISTPVSVDVIPQLFPPSVAQFNSSLLPALRPILQFLKDTDSIFMLNAHPYLSFTSSGSRNFPIDYALFRPLPPARQVVDPNTQFHYPSMFDAMVDAVFFAMSSANFSNIPVLVSESGWPWHGGADEQEATIDNAIVYNTNLINRILNGKGTPAKPNSELQAYIFELFIEDTKSSSDRSWGLYFPNGTAVYTLKISITDTNSTTIFCIAKPGADAAALKKGLDWACGAGGANCSNIQSGQPCYAQNNLQSIASYAYNDYYSKNVGVGGSCDFNGTGMTTSSDPSTGSCKFVGSLSGGGNGGGTGVIGTSTPESAPGPSSSSYFPTSSALDSSFTVSVLLHLGFSFVLIFSSLILCVN